MAGSRLAAPEEFVGPLEYCHVAIIREEEGELFGYLGAQIVDGKALLGPLEHDGDPHGLTEMWFMMRSRLIALGLTEVFAPVHEGNRFLQDALMRSGFEPVSIQVTMRCNIGK